jgi:hypothetical protein
VVLPERGVDLSRFKKTLDMPCCIFHSMMYGKCGDLGIAGKKDRNRIESPDSLISQRVFGIAPQYIDLPQMIRIISLQGNGFVRCPAHACHQSEPAGV